MRAGINKKGDHEMKIYTQTFSYSKFVWMIYSYYPRMTNL